ncbi:hypothetical protein, partial [Sphaerochaeta sp. S2]|uniref:hypothetical protein n=1 Tax=Sphaerochaeta sp. S2 TaxID=2798868 RepID=UPI0018EA3174
LRHQSFIKDKTKTGEHHYLVTASEDIRQNLAQQVFSAGCNLTSLELKKHSLNEIYQLAYKEASNE